MSNNNVNIKMRKPDITLEDSVLRDVIIYTSGVSQGVTIATDQIAYIKKLAEEAELPKPLLDMLDRLIAPVLKMRNETKVEVRQHQLDKIHEAFPELKKLDFGVGIEHTDTAPTVVSIYDIKEI